MKTYFPLLILVLLSAANTVFAQRPASPTNGNATAISRTQLSISWEDNSNNEEGFAVYTFPGSTFLGTIQANSTSAIVPDLSGGSRVQYAIFAYNQSDGLSASYALTPLIRMPDEITQSRHQASVGQSFSAALYTDDSGLQTSASVSGRPDWATFNQATRTLSGTPDVAGTYTLDLVVNYSDGFSINETVTLEVIDVRPKLVTTLPTPEYYTSTESQSIDLSAYFTDPDSRSVRMNFRDFGPVDILLYESATPVTVINFLKYVTEEANTGQNRYNGSMVHRSAYLADSVTKFVIQGGGYRPTGGNSFESVPDFGTITNEPGLENVRGTIAMAKLGGDPNSATSEWFINMEDNRAILDAQNGGFTVFGRVVGNGMTVVDAIADLPRGNYPNITVDGISRSGLLSECPMNATTAPANMEQDKLVVLESAVEIDPLAYEIVTNSDSSVAQATVSDDSTLQVTPLKSGNCTLRIKATDWDGNEIEEDITITVVDWTFDEWSAAQGLGTGQGGILDDADGDSLSNFIEYALFGDSTTSTPALTKSQKVSAGTSVTEDYLAIEFSTRNGIEDTLVCVEVVDQLSPNAIWTEIWNSDQGSSAAQVHSADVATDHIDWVIRDEQTIGSGTSRFMRIRVERVDSQ